MTVSWADIEGDTWADHEGDTWADLNEAVGTLVPIEVEMGLRDRRVDIGVSTRSQIIGARSRSVSIGLRQVMRIHD